MAWRGWLQLADRHMTGNETLDRWLTYADTLRTQAGGLTAQEGAVVFLAHVVRVKDKGGWKGTTSTLNRMLAYAKTLEQRRDIGVHTGPAESGTIYLASVIRMMDTIMDKQVLDVMEKEFADEQN